MIGKIENAPGMINQDTGMIENSIGLIEENIGLIIETNDVEGTENGRRKRSKERGKDSKPRNFPLHTIKNLPQFRNKSHKEVRQYILAKKGIDIGSNFNFGSLMLCIIVALAIVAGVFGIAKWLQLRHERKRNEKTC